MRVLTIKELQTIMGTLPAANDKNAKDKAVIKMEGTVLPNGTVLPDTHLSFVRAKMSEPDGSIKWRWLYLGPLPLAIDPLTVNKEAKKVETQHLLL